MKKLSKDEQLQELDHLFRCAHEGYGLEDKEFKCTIKACPQIYQQIRQGIEAQAENDEIHARMIDIVLDQYERLEAQAEPSEEHVAVFPGIGAVSLSEKPELRGLTIEEVVRKYPEQVAKVLKELPMRKPKVSRANLRTMVLKIIMSTIELQDKIKGKSFTISTYLESCLNELLANLEEAGMEVEE